jgi:hypothetical protein
MWILTIATAGEESISSPDTTAKYAMFAVKYISVTIGMAIQMARGRFL